MYFWPLCQKSCNSSYTGLNLGPQFYSIDLRACFCSSNMLFLLLPIIKLEIKCAKSSHSFCFACCCFGYPWSVCRHIHLISFASNLYIDFRRITIFTRSLLPTHEHGRPIDFLVFSSIFFPSVFYSFSVEVLFLWLGLFPGLFGCDYISF